MCAPLLKALGANPPPPKRECRQRGQECNGGPEVSFPQPRARWAINDPALKNEEEPDGEEEGRNTAFKLGRGEIADVGKRAKRKATRTSPALGLAERPLDCLFQEPKRMLGWRRGGGSGRRQNRPQLR